MSNAITVQFEVRNLAIMKDTLQDLGLKFTERDQILEIQRSRYPISINAETGLISFDSDQTHEVNNIKQKYMANFFRDQAIKEGMSISQEVNAQGEIEIYLSN